MAQSFGVKINIKARSDTRRAVKGAITDMKLLTKTMGANTGKAIAAINRASAAAIKAQSLNSASILRTGARAQTTAHRREIQHHRRVGRVLGDKRLERGRRRGTFAGGDLVGGALAASAARRRAGVGSGGALDRDSRAARKAKVGRGRSASAVDAAVAAGLARRAADGSGGKFTRGAAGAPARTAASRTVLGLAGDGGTKLGGVGAVTAAGGAALGGLLATGLIIKGMTSSVSKFEDASVGLQSTLRADGDQMAQLTKQSIGRARAGRSLFSAAEITKAQEFGALAGLDTKEILQATPVALNLATATRESAAFASDSLTDIATAMGLGTDRFGQLGDVLLRTTQIANTNFRQLSGAMLKFAPTAAQLGFSMEQSSALLGVLADKGVKGSTAGLAVSRIFTRLASGKTPVRKGLAKLGLTERDLADDKGNLKAPAEQIRIINEALTKKFGKDNDQGKSAVLTQLLGTRAGKTFQQLASGLDELHRKEQRLALATGAVANAVNLRMETLSSKTSALGNTFDALLVSGGEGGLLGAMKNMVDFANTILSKDEKTERQAGIERLKERGTEGGVSDKTLDLLNEQENLRAALKTTVFGFDIAPSLPEGVRQNLERQLGVVEQQLNAPLFQQENEQVNAAIDKAAEKRRRTGTEVRTGSEASTRSAAEKREVLVLKIEVDQEGTVKGVKKVMSKNVEVVLDGGSQVDSL